MLGVAAHDLDQQALLGAEVVVQKPAADARLAGHVLEGRARGYRARRHSSASRRRCAAPSHRSARALGCCLHGTSLCRLGGWMPAADRRTRGAHPAKLGAARRRANSRAIREEVGGDPAPRRGASSAGAAIGRGHLAAVDIVVDVYSNSSSAPKRASSTVLRASSLRIRATAAPTRPSRMMRPRRLFLRFFGARERPRRRRADSRPRP